MKNEQQMLETVQDYYGRVLQTKKDLQTSTCCSIDSIPRHLLPIVKEIHSEIHEKFYGCGSPIPSELQGRTVLDLGCGTGRDCYILSKLVGPFGQVIGVDMTDSQLEIARKHQNYHAEKFGFMRTNIRFLKGYIEDLESLGIETASVDVVISNCVLNLSPNKKRAFSEIFRVLKPGGELYFSDIFADRRIPQALAEDPVLLGECLGGALYIEDFRRLLFQNNCPDYRTVSRSKLDITNADIERKAGMIGFYSMTLRAFKLNLEDRCEDYGQVAYYLGTLPENPHHFMLDDHHFFKTGQPMLICSNTASMISETRYARYFKVIGDTSVHYGLFDCAPKSSSLNESPPTGACC